jgi:hypothetical protein
LAGGRAKETFQPHCIGLSVVPPVGAFNADAAQEQKRSEDRTADKDDHEEYQGATRPGATGWGIHRRNDGNGSEEPYCDTDAQKGKGITKSIPL